jgi:hypothetical protein
MSSFQNSFALFDVTTNSFLKMTIHWRNLANNSRAGAKSTMGVRNSDASILLHFFFCLYRTPIIIQKYLYFLYLLSSTKWQKRIILSYKNIGGIFPILHPAYVTWHNPHIKKLNKNVSFTLRLFTPKQDSLNL